MLLNGIKAEKNDCSKNNGEICLDKVLSLHQKMLSAFIQLSEPPRAICICFLRYIRYQVTLHCTCFALDLHYSVLQS